MRRVATAGVTAFGSPLPYLVQSHTKPNNRARCVGAFTIHQAQACIKTDKRWLSTPLSVNVGDFVVRSVSLGDTPLVTSILFSDPQYSSFHQLLCVSLMPLVVSTHTCHLCTIPPSRFSTLLVCSRSACTHCYIVSMDFFLYL